MNSMVRKNKKLILVLIIIAFVIAGFLDIKYQGLFFQLLPNQVQAYLTKIF